MARVTDLEARLGQNSSNSNQPPSKDTPEQRRDREKSPPSGRKRGGQPGHKPQRREMLPPEKVSQIENHHPGECEHCGSSLPRVEDADAVRHQVVDLPEIQADVTEHRMHATDCEECGHRTRASLPTGVPRSMFGPRLLALTSPLTRTDPFVPSKTDPASRTRFRSGSAIWGRRRADRSASGSAADARSHPGPGRMLTGRLAFGARAQRYGRCGSGGASG